MVQQQCASGGTAKNRILRGRCFQGSNIWTLAKNLRHINQSEKQLWPMTRWWCNQKLETKSNMRGESDRSSPDIYDTFLVWVKTIKKRLSNFVLKFSLLGLMQDRSHQTGSQTDGSIAESGRHSDAAAAVEGEAHQNLIINAFVDLFKTKKKRNNQCFHVGLRLKILDSSSSHMWHQVYKHIFGQASNSKFGELKNRGGVWKVFSANLIWCERSII